MRPGNDQDEAPEYEDGLHAIASCAKSANRASFAPSRLSMAAATGMSSESILVDVNDTADRPSAEGDTLALPAAAKAAGVSESTLRRLVRDGLVDAIRDGHKIRLTQATVLELQTGAGLKRGPSISMREAERSRSDLAAECFVRFREGKSLISIVEELKALPAVVKSLWNEWLDLQSSQRRAIRLECLHAGHADGCDSPPQPHIGLCSRHAAQSRILTSEQKAVLQGREIPKAAHCKACDEFATECVCANCLALYTVITVEGDSHDRRVVVRVRDQVVASEPAGGIANQLGLIASSPQRRSKKEPAPALSSIESALGVSSTPSRDDVMSLIGEAQKALSR